MNEFSENLTILIEKHLNDKIKDRRQKQGKVKKPAARVLKKGEIKYPNHPKKH